MTTTTMDEMSMYSFNLSNNDTYATDDDLNTTTKKSVDETIEAINCIAYGIIAKIIVSVGILGHILSLIVLTRPNLTGVMYTYLIALAMSNLCVLVTAIFPLDFLSNEGQTEYYLVAFFQAHMALPLLNTFMASSVYIMVFTTINRYISIHKPTQFQHHHTFKKAYFSIAVSFIGGTIIHIPLCFEQYVVMYTQNDTQVVEDVVTHNQSTLSNVYIYTTKEADHAFYPLYQLYIFASELLLRIGPIIALTCLNVKIIIKFCRIVKKRQVLRGTITQRGSSGQTGVASVMVSPPAATSEAFDQQHANGTHQGNNSLKVSAVVNYPSAVSQSYDIDTNTMATLESNNGPIEETSPLNGKDTPSASGRHVENGFQNGSNHRQEGQEEGRSGNSSRRESPLRNQSIQNLLVAARPRALTNTSSTDLPRGAWSTPHRASIRRRGLHNPEERVLVLVLVTIVIMFVICTTPAAALSILNMSKRIKTTVAYAYFRACANNLELLGFALNFFVYCFCSADIRRAFVDVVFQNWIVITIRKKLLASRRELPQIQVDFVVPEDNGDEHHIRPAMASVHLVATPSHTCVHNNEVIVVNITDNPVNSNSKGNVAV